MNNFIIVAILALLTACHSSKKIALNDTQPILEVPMADSGIILPVIIKNKHYNFLLDTGASYSIIDNNLASILTSPTQEKHIPIYFYPFLTDGLTVVHSTLNQFKLWQPIPIRLGTHTIFSSDPWIGLDLSLLSQAIGQKIDGVFGIEVFRQLGWAIDNKHKTITIWNHSPFSLDYQHCIPYEDAYGQSPALVLSNKNKSGELDFVSLSIDTGSDTTLVSKELLNFWKNSETCQLTLDRKDISGASASGLSTNEIYLIGGLLFDQMPVGDLRISITKNKINKLGFDFFSRFDNYLFIPNKMQFCYNAKIFTHNDKKSLRYISLAYFDGQVEVRYNTPTNIAQYGLLNGDILLIINGKKVSTMSIKQIRELLNNTPPSKLHLLIRRNKNKKTLQI